MRISLEEIGVSSTNTRPKESPADLAELVESIKLHDVLQPVLLRLSLLESDPHRYELICGHRRLAAAKLAGRDDIPAVIRDLTDEQAIEAQITENLQRADLHPLDEAMGFQQLVDRGQSALDVAVSVGKSRAYVYQRLSLLKLPTAAQKLFRAGSMNAPLALLVARIPDEKLQEQAAEKILKGNAVGHDADFNPVYAPLTLAQAQELVQREFMLDMKSAPFDILDAGLVPAAGPCSTCPKRTGNAADLFGDVGKRDLCTDPGCFAGKAEAAWTAACAKRVADGAKALTIAQSEAVMPAGLGGNMRYTAKYVKPGDLTSGGKKSWETLAAASKVEPKTFLARHPKTGKPVVLWQKSEVERLLAKKKPATPADDDAPKSATASADAAKEEAKRVLEARIRERYRALLAKRVRAAVEDMPTDRFLKTLIRIGADEYDADERFSECGHQIPSNAKKWPAFFDGLTVKDLHALVMALYVHFNESDLLHLGVREADVMKQARAEITAEAKAAAGTTGKCAVCGTMHAKGWSRVADPNVKGKFVDVCNNCAAKPAAKKGGKK